MNAALGKCVIWGYRPWATATRCQDQSCSTVSLADYHQACTHLVRADYCGNGVPYTVNGTLIDIFDDLTPPIQARAGSWGLEARWTPSGAFRRYFAHSAAQRHKTGGAGWLGTDSPPARRPNAFLGFVASPLV